MTLSLPITTPIPMIDEYQDMLMLYSCHYTVGVTRSDQISQYTQLQYHNTQGMFQLSDNSSCDNLPMTHPNTMRP